MCEVWVPNIISKDAIVSETVSFGKGAIICARTIMTVDITVGDYVICNLDCTIGHDAEIGDYVTIYPSVNVSGNVNVGRNTELGTGSSIIQGIRIGKYTKIGASAAVVRDIPDYCTAVGIPAKVIK